MSIQALKCGWTISNTTRDIIVRYFSNLLVLFSFVAILSGCSSKELAGDSKLVGNKFINTSYPRATLVTADEKLLNKIEIVNPVFKEVGLMTVSQVTLQNLTGEPYNIQYRFVWQDMQGFDVGNKGMWQTLSISPYDAVSVSSTAKTPKGKKIIFSLRMPRDLFEDLREKELNKR